MVVAFDTSPLIWGVRGESNDSQAPMIERTRLYIEQLRDEDATVIVPTVVVAEYLQGCSVEAMQSELAALTKGFVMYPFNAMSARTAAELAQATDLKGLRQEHDLSRQCLKVDVMVVATAITARADCIVTHDIAHFEKIAAGRIKIVQVPERVIQKSMLPDLS